MTTPQVAQSPRNPLSDLSRLRVTLLKRRAALGLSQEAAAAKIGVGLRTFNRWENRGAEPRALELFKWCAALGVALNPGVEEA